MDKLTNLQYLSLYVGGADGGIVQDADAALAGAELHMIEVLVDNTEFSVLSRTTQADVVVNMLSGVNNYAGKKWKSGSLIFAGHGGFITAFTADADVLYFTLAGSGRDQNES